MLVHKVIKHNQICPATEGLEITISRQNTLSEILFIVRSLQSKIHCRPLTKTLCRSKNTKAFSMVRQWNDQSLWIYVEGYFVFLVVVYISKLNALKNKPPRFRIWRTRGETFFILICFYSFYLFNWGLVLSFLFITLNFVYFSVNLFQNMTNYLLASHSLPLTSCLLPFTSYLLPLTSI